MYNYLSRSEVGRHKQHLHFSRPECDLLEHLIFSLDLMTYPLRQTPVPIWAVSNQQALHIDPENLPTFLLPQESHTRGNFHFNERPMFLKQTGRWNSVMNHYNDSDSYKVRSLKEGNIDHTLLDQYDLNTEWENRMDSSNDENGGIANFDKLKANFLKNLSGNPFFPIALRGSASAFAIITLGLACEVFVQTKKISPGLDPSLVPHSPTASTIFCIVISTISIPYLLFSLWDETFGQPLGLRPSQSKIKFVAIDLALICLSAANLAVAFDTMIGKDFICPAAQNHYICSLHKAVVSFIFVTLAIWFLTFLVSTFRMIDRATH